MEYIIIFYLFLKKLSKSIMQLFEQIFLNFQNKFCPFTIFHEKT